MSYSPSEGSSSDQDDFDDYADLDDYDDGEMYTNDSDEEEGHMSSDTNLEMIIDVEAVKEKFEHLPSKPEVGVAHIHGNVISLYLPFYSYLNKGLQLAWKEYEHSYIVVDLKIDLVEYRQAKTLPVVTTVLSCGTTAPPVQLFCDHLRTVAQNYIQENFKDQEKKVLVGIFEELLGRIENLSNFCCFCDKPLGDEGAFFPTFCPSSFCSFQGEEFLRAHPKAVNASRIFRNVLKKTECFTSLKFSQQSLILHESPGQIVDFEKRCRLKPIRFLYYNNHGEDWMNLNQRNKPTPVSRQPSSDAVGQDVGNWVLCEVVDDPSTLVQVTRNDYLVRDVRSMRFRIELRHGEDSPQLSTEDELRLRNRISALQRPGQPATEERFELGSLPNDLLIRILQLLNRPDIFRFRQASRMFYDFIQAHEDQFRNFKDVTMKIDLFTEEKKEMAKIRLENLIEKRLVEVFADLPKHEIVSNEEQQNALGMQDEDQKADEVLDEKMDVEEEKSMLDKTTVLGGDNDEWKIIRIHVEGQTLKEVVAKLAKMMEITSLEIKKTSLDDVENLLKVLFALRELHIEFNDKYFTVEKLKSFLDTLPPRLDSLSIGGRNVFYSDEVFTHPRLEDLQQLHHYGNGNVTYEAFRALKVKRLCLESTQVVLDGLSDIVKEWRKGAREIEAISVLIDFNNRTNESVLQALQADLETSKIRRIRGNAELKVEILQKKHLEASNRRILQLIAC